MQTAKPASSQTLPATYWQTTVNDPAGVSGFVVPAAGTLFVNYTYSQEPAENIYVAHQGGGITQINVGGNTITVNAGDQLVYRLTNPGSDSIKLEYQMI